MSKLRIGSIMKFDSTKSRKEAYNCGRTQGAVEELERIRNQLDVLPKRHFKEYLRSAIIKRIEELKGEGD